MNPIAKIFTTIIVAINGLINGMSRQTVTMIKQGYFALIFIVVVAAGILAWRAGSGSAAIKSAPLAEKTNDIFERSINREKNSGISDILDRESMISNPGSAGPDKLQIPERDRLEPDTDKGIVDIKPAKITPPGRDEFIFDRSGTEERPHPEVRNLDREENLREDRERVTASPDRFEKTRPSDMKDTISSPKKGKIVPMSKDKLAPMSGDDDILR